MPMKPPSPCAHRGCAHRAVTRGYCAQHARDRERARGSAASRGYDLEWRIKRGTYLKAHWCCVVCGGVATDVDHIIPRSHGGGDAWANLRALCHACHSRRTARDQSGWTIKGGQ
jgi:5-methylcytosine-specific restriction protein A